MFSGYSLFLCWFEDRIDFIIWKTKMFAMYYLTIQATIRVCEHDIYLIRYLELIVRLLIQCTHLWPLFMFTSMCQQKCLISRKKKKTGLDGQIYLYIGQKCNLLEKNKISLKKIIEKYYLLTSSVYLFLLYRTL